jgi:hypothetical protein
MEGSAAYWRTTAAQARVPGGRPFACRSPGVDVPSLAVR